MNLLKNVRLKKEIQGSDLEAEGFVMVGWSKDTGYQYACDKEQIVISLKSGELYYKKLSTETLSVLLRLAAKQLLSL